MNRIIDITFSSLDPSQKNAFESIDNSSDNLHIVHGPPGTGKSQLVVSLLERLASEDKKVLFVSQNTEALKVIERMIGRTEKAIGYPVDSKYLSLSDFCLLLYNPTHRCLKYLREYYTRLSSKSLPNIGSQTALIDVAHVLNYTNLDHIENYSIKDKAVGFDELVSYYLKYVDKSMAPEFLRSFDSVDVRAIFVALDSYPHPDMFAEFNHPRRELALLSSKNTNILLPNVRNYLKIIKSVIVGDWTRLFPSKISMNIVRYFELMEEYSSAIKMFDVYRIAVEGKSIDEIVDSIKNCIDSCEDFGVRIKQIDAKIAEISNGHSLNLSGLSYSSKKISLKQSVLSIAENSFEDVLIDRNRILVLIKEIISKYPDVAHIGLRNLHIGFAKLLANYYNDAIDDENGLTKLLTSNDIDVLNRDMLQYYTQSSVKRMISGVPSSFKSLINISSAKEIDVYRDDVKDTLSVMGEIIKLDDSNIGSILEVAKKATSVKLNRLDVKIPHNIEQAKDNFMPVHELILLLNKYEIDTVDFSDTRLQVKDFSENIIALKDIIGNTDNKKIYITNTLSSFIEYANSAIDIISNKHERQCLIDQTRKIQNESFNQNKQYLRCVNSSVEYIKCLDNIYEYLLNHKLDLLFLLSSISTPSDNMPISDDLGLIVRTINDISLSNNFSDLFFEIKKGQTIKEWLGVITALETYNNDSELVDLIEHSEFIEQIRVALGSDNDAYLTEVLSNDISFKDFAMRIVNVLIDESFGRSSVADKKRITTNDVIGAYSVYIKNRKAVTYCNNLKSIYSHSLEKARQLSKQSTLQASGKSTMDKFRSNINIISEAFPIICATPKDVSKYIAASKGLFDYVIFDEASQLLPGQSIPSIYRAKKAVIIGDPHQMPPSLNTSFGKVEQSEEDFDDLGESILDLVLKQPQKQYHLKVHYRSKYNKLFEPSREIIYDNDGIEPIFEAELANKAPIDIVDDLGVKNDEFGYDMNFYKICESISAYLVDDNTADFCVLFTRSDILSKFKDFLLDVGVRSFGDISKLYDNDKLLLSTVTNCQGVEGAYTVIYIHHYKSPGSMWFFKESAGAYKRLNVSITRQRKGLTVLMADNKSNWIRVCEDKIDRDNVGPNVVMSAKLMRQLLTSAGEQTDEVYLDRKLGDNILKFDSPLTEQLYNKLTNYYSEDLGVNIKIYSEVGWNLLIPNSKAIGSNDRNVGFRIDIGIYSILQKKFVLGIEMDGAMYHSGFDKEHSDYNRQRVLEDKGWEIYRIWSTNWLNDNEREFNRLTRIIDSKLNLS